MTNPKILAAKHTFSRRSRINACIPFAGYALGVVTALWLKAPIAGFALAAVFSATALALQGLLLYKTAMLWRSDNTCVEFEPTDFLLAPLYDTVFSRSNTVLSSAAACFVAALWLIISPQAEVLTYLKDLPLFLLIALATTLILRVVAGLALKNSVILLNTPHSAKLNTDLTKSRRNAAVIIAVCVLFTATMHLVANYVIIRPTFESLDKVRFEAFMADYTAWLSKPRGDNAEFSEIAHVDETNMRIYRNGDLLSAAYKRQTNNEFFIYFYLLEVSFLLYRHRLEKDKLLKENMRTL